MIVADTNLLVYLYLSGEYTTNVEQVLEVDAEWAIPVPWRSEFRNVLAIYLRKGRLEMETALTVFREAEATVAGREYSIETSHVLDLVHNSTCSAYDCEFVALAEELGVPLLTFDKRILTNFPKVAINPVDFAG